MRSQARRVFTKIMILCVGGEGDVEYGSSFCGRPAIQVVATGVLLVSESSRTMIGAGLHLRG